MDLKILFIEDEEKIAQNLKEIFDESTISDYLIKAEYTISFENGVKKIKDNDFDIVVLDLCNSLGAKDEEAGIHVLETIRKTAFVPVIFYTAYAFKIEHLISEIVGVVNKGDGIDRLKIEIERIISSKIALIKSQIYEHLKESLRKFFWETVDTDKVVFVPGKSDVSLGYLILRRFANSLSKENIKEILGDVNIKPEKTHPMEFYIYPSIQGEFQTGEIIAKEGKMYIILTPNCDFVKSEKRDRKVVKVLLAETVNLKESEYYINFMSNKEKFKQPLIQLIESRKGDRFFFLPKTPFIDNHFLDFQIITMVDYKELSSFERVAKLDDPFVQSMVSNFIRYYNRIGFPDIDAEYVISDL